VTLLSCFANAAANTPSLCAISRSPTPHSARRLDRSIVNINVVAAATRKDRVMTSTTACFDSTPNFGLYAGALSRARWRSNLAHATDTTSALWHTRPRYYYARAGKSVYPPDDVSAHAIIRSAAAFRTSRRCDLDVLLFPPSDGEARV